MTDQAPSQAPRPTRRWVRPLLTVVTGVALIPVSFWATVLLAFGLTPTCETTDPPGPPGLIVALVVVVAVAAAVPVVVAGRRLRVLGAVFGVLAAVPPGWALVLVLTTPQTGFCF